MVSFFTEADGALAKQEEQAGEEAWTQMCSDESSCQFGEGGWRCPNKYGDCVCENRKINSDNAMPYKKYRDCCC